ncbi:MAG: UDP-GlcNAc:undecaprenyl-phosphate GlcNAc-1-phosphate transferase [Flavobacteriales bacterium]|jgi:UDP-GlcNAc:undecaprenyl-phosphate GlcNAc-1-phosphate transferase
MLLYVLILATLGWAVNFLLLRFLRTLGTKNQTADFQVRWSNQTKPTIGGVSFFIGFLVSMICAFLFADQTTLMSIQIAALGLSVVLAFLMGLADDAFNTKPWLKFVAQLCCGLVLFLGGVFIETGLGVFSDLLITVFWVVGLMNSVNMLDNMDGVTTAAVLPPLLLIWWLYPSTFIGWLSLGMLATLLGFLVLNWHPSKLYMGDSGSQLLGVFVAGVTIVFVWNHPAISGQFASPQNWVLPVVVLFTPLCDTTLVTINRIRHKRSPFVGGRDHSTHNLSYLGMKDGSITLAYFFWSFLNSTWAYILLTYQGEELFRLKWGTVIYLLIVFISFFMVSRRNLQQGKYSYS